MATRITKEVDIAYVRDQNFTKKKTKIPQTHQQPTIDNA